MQKIYILVGPSGSGKTALINELTKRNPDFVSIPSVTTRAPRNVPEPDYRFLTPEEFEEEKKEGRLLEYSSYAGNWYGTSLSDFTSALSSGKCLIKAMDAPGARAVKEQFPERTITIFLRRSRDALIRSILDRKTGSADTVARIGALVREERPGTDCDLVLENNGTIEDLYQNFLNLIKE